MTDRRQLDQQRDLLSLPKKSCDNFMTFSAPTKLDVDGPMCDRYNTCPRSIFGRFHKPNRYLLSRFWRGVNFRQLGRLLLPVRAENTPF
jgi:hypothetical protein